MLVRRDVARRAVALAKVGPASCGDATVAQQGPQYPLSAPAPIGGLSSATGWSDLSAAAASGAASVFYAVSSHLRLPPTGPAPGALDDTLGGVAYLREPSQLPAI